MHLTNSSPLITSPIGAKNFNGHQSLRRNASGVMAGENIFRAGMDTKFNLPHERVIQEKNYNNRIRENWLQDRMMDNLDRIKQTYGKYGGQNADFVNQVRDMENYLHFNKPPALNQMSGAVPYQQLGPATVYASPTALPPQIYNSAPNMFPYQAPYVDQDRRVLRTQLVSQKQQINELNEELNSLKREGQRFDDLLNNGHSDIHKLRATNFPGVSLATYHDSPGYGDGMRKPVVKWGNAETDQTLHGLALKEQDLIRALSKMPENTDLYKQKKSKLDDLVRQRTELEKMMYSKADYKNYMHDRLVDDQKKDNIAQWLRRDLQLFKIDQDEEQQFKYRHQVGFIVYWDYILNLVKEFKQIQIVYGIYNKGLTLFEPRLVQLTDTIDTTHPNFAQVIFGINHLVREVEAHPDILLIFEVQIPAMKNIQTAKGSQMNTTLDSRMHNGYSLSRYGNLKGPDQLDAQGNYIDKMNDDNMVFQTYAWSCIDLFNFKNELKRGTYKVPIYKPPTIINLDVRDIPQLERRKDTMIWMRICHPRDDELNEVRCEPAYYHIYYVPEIHNIAPKVEMKIKPERNPNYRCEGLTFYIHFVSGYVNDRHVRVACALQMGKDIVVQDNGNLCFYVTRGINAMTSIIGQGILKAIGSMGRQTRASVSSGTAGYDEDRSIVSYNEKRTWYKDFYNLMWDFDMEENLYLIFQYLERKPYVEEPTNTTVITRKLLDDEYDILGYTVLQLNHPTTGEMKFGTYIMDLYKAPVFVEELDALKRTEMQIKITVGRPGEELKNEGDFNQNFRKSMSLKRKSMAARQTAASVAGVPNLFQPSQTPKSRGSSNKKSTSPNRKSPKTLKPSSKGKTLTFKPNKESSRDKGKSSTRKLDQSMGSARGTPKGSARNSKVKSMKGKTPESPGRRGKYDDEREDDDYDEPRSKKGRTGGGNRGSASSGQRGDPFDLTKALNDQIKAQPKETRNNNFFIPNEMPQHSGRPFKPNMGVDFYIDQIRFLPDNATVTKVQIQAMTTEKTPISVSAGGLPDLYDSLSYHHVYGFRYEYRQPKFNPTTVVFLTIYTIDRTNNQVRTLGYSAINLFLNKSTLEPSYSSKDTDAILQEGSYQLPIFIQDPRKLPELRMPLLMMLEKIPCASILVRIKQSPTDQKGLPLTVKTVPQNEWGQLGLVTPAPDYSEATYNTQYCRVTDVEMEVFPSRAERIENPLRETAEQLMQAIRATKSRNTDTLLDWIDLKLSVENEDPPILDIKYFATYDSDFGFKIAVDGIHNLPKRQGVFYIVVISLNPPASLYTESKLATSDVNLVSTFDWDSSVLSIRFLDNYMYYQNIQGDPSMTIIMDVRSIEFQNGVPQTESVAWSACPLFFQRYNNFYVRSGIFQLPLFKGQVDFAHLQQMYNFDDPWSYLVQKLNDRSIQLWGEGASLIVRLIDSQREGHYARAFDFDRFSQVYMPESLLIKMNYVYTTATDQRLANTPRLSTIIPNGADKVAFQESIMRTFASDNDVQHQDEQVKDKEFVSDSESIKEKIIKFESKHQLKHYKINFLYIITYIFILSLGPMQLGYLQTETNQLNPYFIQLYGWANDKQQQIKFVTGINSSGFFGVCIGALYGGHQITKGRRKSLLIANAVGFIGVGIELIQNVWCLISGRMIYGIACGIFLIAVPRMIEESVPIQNLGSFGMSTSIAINGGILISIILAAGLPEGTEESQYWRLIIGYPWILQIIQVLFLIFAYKEDTLKFLINKKDHIRALKVIKRTYIDTRDPEEILHYMKSIGNKEESDKIQRVFLQEDESLIPTYKDALFDKRYRKATIICIFLCLFQQFTGYIAILSYSSQILKTIENQSIQITSKQQTYLIALINFLSSLISVLFSALFGRKNLFIYGFIFVGLDLILIGVFYSIGIHLDVLIFIFLLVFLYLITIGSILIVYLTEVLVDTGLGICIFALQIWQLIVTALNQFLMESPLKVQGVFWLYGGISFVGAIYCIIFLKETYGLTDKQKMDLYNPYVEKFNKFTKMTKKRQDDEKKLLKDE